MEVALESSKYIRLEHQNPLHKDVVVINWCLGNVCNYACSYCPDNLHSGTQPFPAFDVVKNFIDKTIQHHSQKKLYFEFTGGEVTLWKDLMPTLTYLRERGCKTGIISNGSRSLEFYTKLVEKIDHICISFHPESAKEDHFFSVVELFADKIRTHVNIMMSPLHFDRCTAFAMKLKYIDNISMALQPLMEGLNGKIYSYSELQNRVMDQQFNLVIKHIQYTKQYEYYRGSMAMVMPSGERKDIASQNFISAGNNSWKYWECYAGVEQMVVNMDGEIFRGWCLAGGKIGKISDASLKLPSKPIRCPVNKCHCNLDIMCTKEKNL
jgi:MoaA/NifB/PqqE/SkfB family radical SAM enzyme